MDLLPLHQFLICGTYVLPRLCQFWTQLRGKLAHEGPYKQVSIGSRRRRLPKLQAEDQKAWRIREQGLKDGWEQNADRILCHQGLPYIPEIICSKLISRH